MFRKTIIVNPPSPPGFVSNKDSMGGFGQLYPLGATLFPPLDLIHLASYLVEKTHSVELLESLALDQDQDRLLAKIAATKEPALIVVRTSAPTLDWDLSVCDAIKRQAPDSRMNPTWIQFTAASPFIGTKLRDWAVAEGLVTDDDYAYINSHSVTIGNENLSKEQGISLFRFARFFQTFLLNRKGILKDDRPSKLHTAVKGVADLVSIQLAHLVFAAGRMWFARWNEPAPLKLVQA